MPKDSQNCYYKYLMIKFLNFSAKFLIIFFSILIIFVFQLYGIFQLDYLIIKSYQTINHQYQVEYIQSDSKLIAEYAIEKRLFIPFESIPDKVVNSFYLLKTKIFKPPWN